MWFSHSLVRERESVNNNNTLSVNAESNINENNEIGTASTNFQSFDNNWITVRKNADKKKAGAVPVRGEKKMKSLVLVILIVC